MLLPCLLFLGICDYDFFLHDGHFHLYMPFIPEKNKSQLYFKAVATTDKRHFTLEFCAQPDLFVYTLKWVRGKLIAIFMYYDGHLTKGKTV
jgi:hypothetical protein